MKEVNSGYSIERGDWERPVHCCSPLTTGYSSELGIVAQMQVTGAETQVDGLGLQQEDCQQIMLTDEFAYTLRFRFVVVVLVAKSCPTLWDSMDCTMPGFPVPYHLLEFAQTHAHWVANAIQTSHSLSPLSPSAPNLPQHQGLFQWVSSSHQVAKVLELQLQQKSFQWIFRVDFL